MTRALRVKTSRVPAGMKEVRSMAQMEKGTFVKEGAHVALCLDLAKGESLAAWRA